MNDRTIRAFEALSLEIRHCFNVLKSASDRLLADSGVTTAQRAVLERLTRGGPATVPQIARERSVSRQHVQTMADALQGSGLVEWRDNPGHKRSQLLALSEKGAQFFAQVQQRERALVQELLAGIDDEQMDGARQTLEQLSARLSALAEPR